MLMRFRTATSSSSAARGAGAGRRTGGDTGTGLGVCCAAGGGDAACVDASGAEVDGADVDGADVGSAVVGDLIDAVSGRTAGRNTVNAIPSARRSRIGVARSGAALLYTALYRREDAGIATGPVSKAVTGG